MRFITHSSMAPNYCELSPPENYTNVSSMFIQEPMPLFFIQFTDNVQRTVAALEGSSAETLQHESNRPLHRDAVRAMDSILRTRVAEAVVLTGAEEI